MSRRVGIVLAALLVAGCAETPKVFRVGDCVRFKSTERWELPVMRIEEVGMAAYRVIYYDPSLGWMTGNGRRPHSFEFTKAWMIQKTDCP